jgi:acyl-CoA thioester hydrolase
VSDVFRHRVRVRYGECDPQGVVFNAHYLANFDLTITELWRESVPGGYLGMTARGVDMVVAETRLEYHLPARFDDEIDIEVTVTRLGTTGMTTRLAVTRAADLLLDGEMRHVFVDLGTHEKTPIPDDVRAALEPYTA